MFSPAPDPGACEKLCVKAGFLTHPILRQPSHPIFTGQWQQNAVDFGLSRPGFTAAGTVRDSHPVPYYLRFSGRKAGAPSQGQIYSDKIKGKPE